MCTPKRVMHTKNSVLSKARHLKMSQSGAILTVVNICVGSRGGAAGGELQGQLWRQLGWRTGASVAAVKVAGGLAVEAARVATGGVVVKTAEEASVQAATWAAFEAAGGTFVDAALEAAGLEDRGVCGSCKSSWRVGCGGS